MCGIFFKCLFSCLDGLFVFSFAYFLACLRVCAFTLVRLCAYVLVCLRARFFVGGTATHSVTFCLQGGKHCYRDIG